MRLKGCFSPSFAVRVLPVLFSAMVFMPAPSFGQDRFSLDSVTEPRVVPKLGSGTPLEVENLLGESVFSGVRDYQLGDEWGKQAVEIDKLANRDAVYVRSVQATAFFNSATSFLLGRFGGEFVMATNHHVLGSQSECSGRSVQFTVRRKKYACKAMIGSWPEIDLALFTITVPQADSVELMQFGRNFDFVSPLDEDTQLLTAGFGIAGNSQRKMMVNENMDCRVVSGRNEFRLMADPDQYNPAEYKAWSFATACSVSHGDSGSALVERKTGRVLGILWTGAIPKESRVQSSSYIRDIQIRKDEEVWSLLTYAVPALKIGQKLNVMLDAGDIPNAFTPIVRELVSGK